MHYNSLELCSKNQRVRGIRDREEEKDFDIDAERVETRILLSIPIFCCASFLAVDVRVLHFCRSVLAAAERIALRRVLDFDETNQRFRAAVVVHDRSVRRRSCR